jgi:Family of unknown function (DUF5715)
MDANEPQPGPGPGPDLAGYRQAVGDLLLEVAGYTGWGDLAKAEKVLTERLADPDLEQVLSATPGGTVGATERLLREVRQYQPGPCSAAADLPGHIRIHLCALIDIMWWGRARAFVTDAELLAAPELADLEPLRRAGALGFSYRRQAGTLAARAARAAQRRLRPDAVPRTAGLRFTRARPEIVTLLNQVAAEFATAARPGTPPLWVTSLARSIEHQRRLRALGYTASLPSAHCVGYAVDLEMAWFRQFGAAAALARVLLARQAAGQVNVIDEGQAWHICLSPAGGGAMAPAGGS